MVPALRWLPEYRAEWLRPDLVAGLTLAAYLLPASIGNASLAGLPPEAGLYACLFSGLVFWLLCSSKHTVITTTSALSLLIGASVGELSAGDPGRHAALAAGVTLMVAAIAFAAWLVRAGNAISFFSETVLVGFKAGLALDLASTQLPKLFGFKGTHGDFWERSAYFITHLGQTHQISLLVGVVALTALVAGKLWVKNRPVAFLVVVAGMLAARFLDLETQGVALLGQVPQGLPALGLPEGSRRELNDLLPVALAGFVLGAVETSAIGRMFGQKHGHRLRRQSGAPGPRRRQSRRGARPGVPGERRHVAVARQRECGRTHAAVGPGGRRVHADRRALRLRTAPEPAATRAGGHRARRRHQPRRRPRAAAHLAVQPGGVLRGDRGAPRGAGIRPRQRRAAWRRDLDRAPAPASRASTRDRARPGSGDDVLRRSRAPSGERGHARRAGGPL